MKRRLYSAFDFEDCPECGEPWCKLHKKHWCDCSCISVDNAIDDNMDVFQEGDKVYANLTPAQLKALLA